MALKPERWPDLERKLDWYYTYVDEQDVFPELVSGRPWLRHADWADWDEPYRTSYAEYVAAQQVKEASVRRHWDALEA